MHVPIIADFGLSCKVTSISHFELDVALAYSEGLRTVIPIESVHPFRSFRTPERGSASDVCVSGIDILGQAVNSLGVLGSAIGLNRGDSPSGMIRKRFKLRR